MSKKIKFIDTLGNTPKKYHPYPCKNNIPEWLKNMDNYSSGKKEILIGDPFDTKLTNATVKKCIPVFDVITSGYIIPTSSDLYVSNKDGNLYYQWPNEQIVGFHSTEQLGKHPYMNNTKEILPRYINNWGITTPPGYSCLFIPPTHRESVISILEAIVDTDTFSQPVSFPFKFNTWGWTGLIPAGTPLVQVIPFKRDNFSMEISENEKDKIKIQKIYSELRSVFNNGYKNNFWSKKQYN